ncbi:MAG: putative peptidyl-prolyl cis-trans isomerase cyclophilin type [Frankiales bacterium]|nr:putative peptidyl-prolyl cis-trans isomerase cyclophilin type [Frankiales bacterium]
MAGSKREKELARQRAERQAARRAAAAARRKQRTTVVASVVAVLLVTVGIAIAAAGLSRGDKGVKAAASAATPKASAAASSAASGKPGTCTYTDAGTASRKVDKPPTEGIETKGVFTATLQTNVGQIAFDMDAAKTPCTTNSMRSLAHFSYFDKTPCHRLTSQGIFVLQCGDPSGDGTGGPGYRFADENLTGATYPRGTVAMANSGPGTNGSQFFLVYKDSQLPPDYTPFGTITQGLDVLDKVAKAGSTPPGDGKPKTAVTIERFRTAAKPA